MFCSVAAGWRVEKQFFPASCVRSVHRLRIKLEIFLIHAIVRHHCSFELDSMSSTSQKATKNSAVTRAKYPRAVEMFLFDALRHAQVRLGKLQDVSTEDSDAHISGSQLLESVRLYALERFGLMARTVFHCWSIYNTGDFGRIVFDLIDRGDMSKTENDQLSDFFDLYDFEEGLDGQYKIDVTRAQL